MCVKCLLRCLAVVVGAAVNVAVKEPFCAGARRNDFPRLRHTARARAVAGARPTFINKKFT